MMIVMLGHEEHEINHPHRLFEPRVQGSAEDELVVVGFESANVRLARCPEFREHVREWSRVVIRVVRLSVLEISCAESLCSALEIVETHRPQPLEVQQVTRVLLNRPGVTHAPRERGFPDTAQTFLNTRGRPTKSFDDIRVRPRLEIERKFSRKPQHAFSHR